MSNACTDVKYSPPTSTEVVVFPILYILLCLFICGGNILTIVAVWKNTVLRTTPNMYVVSLAVADLMVGGLVIPMQICRYISSISETLDANKLFCVIKFVIFSTSVASSIFFMVAIAFDRALYIGYPLRYLEFATAAKARLVIIIGWLWSFILGTPHVYYNNWDTCKFCQASVFIKPNYQLYIQNASFFVAFVLTSICYGFILKIARKQQNQILQSQVPDAKKKFENDLKLVKLFLLVFVIFAVCWLPLVLAVTIDQITHSVPGIALFIVIPLCLLNSGMNFVVYAIKNADFRQTFYKILGFKNLH
ncbi:hypothetical protein SNE40_020213 [Patella caerulea]